MPGDLAAQRDDALAIFAAGLEAADPARAVRRSLRIGLGGGAVTARDEVVFPGRLRVVAVGKAACTMARAVAEMLPAEAFPGPGIAVVNDENALEVERFRVLRSGHPLPDERGAAASLEVERYVSGARREDGLLVLLSGGGSALLPAPAEGISLDEKTAVTRLLLRAGADIRELNTVRKHTSRLKGGGLAARAHPASVEALILSDVIGDDLSTIASGLTAPDPTTFQAAREVLERRGVWPHAPASVRGRIERGIRGEVPETPKPGAPIFGRVLNRIVSGNSLSLDAAARKAAELDYAVAIASRALVGEAREAALALGRALDEAEARAAGRARPLALLAGGETTVTVRGRGTGGRNQELALAFALAMQARGPRASWTLLSAGTDGRDGPTDAAGATVDAGTIARGVAAGLDPGRSLDDNDSYAFLDASGDLLRTGATGTNVADLQVLLVGAGRRG
ncbi:MAG: DUF4147 domain-containing protein [Planctomycetes bacterium]|nr:DUF4147 domain-containing protein [Planctomycetota bacterium]